VDQFAYLTACKLVGSGELTRSRGIPGNLAVLIIYRHKYSKSVYRTIIWNLALTDLVFCTLTIPFNIGRLVRYYTFTELWV
jgi:hypothetical protein